MCNNQLFNSIYKKIHLTSTPNLDPSSLQQVQHHDPTESPVVPAVVKKNILVIFDSKHTSSSL
jgi:hypothetical protein